MAGYYLPPAGYIEGEDKYAEGMHVITHQASWNKTGKGDGIDEVIKTKQAEEVVSPIALNVAAVFPDIAARVEISTSVWRDRNFVRVTLRPVDEPRIALSHMDARKETWQNIVRALVPLLGMEAEFRGSVMAPPATKRASTLRRQQPDDTEPLVLAIGEAHAQGRPFNRTGKNGLHARRAELGVFSNMGRDKLEALAMRLIDCGELVTDEAGLLAVTDSVPNS